MSAHCSLAASIDLSTLKVLGVCHQDFVFLLSVVADIHRNTCINERMGGKVRSVLSAVFFFLKLSIYTRGDVKRTFAQACDHPWCCVCRSECVSYKHARTHLHDCFCTWNNRSLKKAISEQLCQQ